MKLIHYMNRTIILFFFLFTTFLSFSKSDSLTTNQGLAHPILSFHYTLNNPILSWKDRFGIFNSVGMNLGYKTKKNWYFLLENNFIFGNKINENSLLDNLKDSYGNITDDQGNIATVPLFSRGWNSSIVFGKLFKLKSTQVETGILLNLGLGFLSYKYRIETNSENIPQLEKDYSKGYDRLTQGLLFSEYLGYQFVSERELLNFNAGFYFMQGLTKNIRTINYDQPNTPVSKNVRIEGSYGLKFGWNIPFFNDKPKDYYYY
jgi:hypothetical protein